MLISIGGQEINKYKSLLKERKVVQYWMDEGIKNCDRPYRLVLPATNENKVWDEYLHPSYLDWSKKPESQVAGLARKGQYHIHDASNRMFHCGNIFHGAINHLVAPAFTTAYDEIGLRIEKYRFKGTADFIGYHPIMGWVLLEFKSYGELQRDATTGAALVKRLESMLHAHKTNRNETHVHASEYASTLSNISYFQMAKIRERLLTCERDMSVVDSGHETQAFTYTWLIQKRGYGVQRKIKDGKEVLMQRTIPKIDRVCVCYVGKGKFETVEFWYNVKKRPDLIQKAEKNYIAVYKEAVKRGYFK